MQVYFYTDQEVGVPWQGPDYDHARHGFKLPRFHWSAFTEHWEARDPLEADVFVVRQRLSLLDDATLAKLPYLHGRVRRHVFFDLADNFNIYPSIRGAMQFRGCADREMMLADPGIIPIPWPVEDLGPGHFDWEYDVSFQGQHNELADRAMESCVRAGLKCNFNPLEKFWPLIRNEDPERGAELKRTFVENILSARLSLCPRTLQRGVVRYRFYEAMTLNRISVLLGDSCKLPFWNNLDWKYACLWFLEKKADSLGEAIAAWLSMNTDEILKEKGLYVRQNWLKYLSRERYDQMIAEIVEREFNASNR